MQLKPVVTVGSIEPRIFKKNFYLPGIPIVIKDLSKDWPAVSKWNWDYFKQLVGNKKVPLYNNVKSDAYRPVNKEKEKNIRKCREGDDCKLIRNEPLSYS